MTIGSKQFRPEFVVAISICGALWLGVVGLTAYLPAAMSAAALDSAFSGNLEAAAQIKLTRGYYTQNVIAKVMQSGALTPKHQHSGDPRAIPLPATFVLDISELLKARDTAISLVSPYPWPQRATRKMDEFQTMAWEAFQKDPMATFSRQEILNGKRVLRVAIADRMTSQTCIDCHNTHPESAKKDWKLNDVRAVMEVDKVIEGDIANAERRAYGVLWVLSATALLLTFMLFVGARIFSKFQSQKRVTISHIQYLAHHDAMTGALNRTHFLSLVSKKLAPQTQPGAAAIHYIDLDGFKEINDHFGHGVGDELIKQVVKRLKTFMTPQCLVGRLGGDEFVIAQFAVKHPEDAIKFAERIVQGMSVPFQLHEQRLCISTSLGLAFTSSARNTGEKLLEAADIALYQAKNSGRNRYSVFSQDMSDALDARRNLEDRLKSEDPAETFYLYFQPIIDCDMKLCGFEALLRMPDGMGGFIPPAEFIPAAEKNGAIERIGAWAIKKACEVAATWPPHLKIAVNLSPAQFGNTPSVSEIVHEALTISGLAPERLELEITEGLLFESTQHAVSELIALKKCGTTIVMDDFGTGYSSLSYLWKLPLDKIKIDKSFIIALLEAADAIAPILNTIISLGRALNVKITAEGVEKIEHAIFLRQLGCDYLQGFLFGRAVPEEDVASLILQDFRKTELYEQHEGVKQLIA